VLAILHGHGPNARLWPFVWERFADEHRLTVAAPSFGYGAWEHPDGVGVVERCLYAVSFGPADMSRVYLAGISQGGAGVLRAAAAAPDRYAGLILLSPTIEPEVVESPAFRDGWRGRPVFVAHGGRDHNVTPESVAAGVAAMRAAGVDVTFHFDPDADHFLFFADLDGVHRRIGEWLRGTIPG
jgi:pimeloyl-ACP methyl ester carboxylesterase